MGPWQTFRSFYCRPNSFLWLHPTSHIAQIPVPVMGWTYIPKFSTLTFKPNPWWTVARILDILRIILLWRQCLTLHLDELQFPAEHITKLELPHFWFLPSSLIWRLTDKGKLACMYIVVCAWYIGSKHQHVSFSEGHIYIKFWARSCLRDTIWVIYFNKNNSSGVYNIGGS